MQHAVPPLPEPCALLSGPPRTGNLCSAGRAGRDLPPRRTGHDRVHVQRTGHLAGVRPRHRAGIGTGGNRDGHQRNGVGGASERSLRIRGCDEHRRQGIHRRILQEDLRRRTRRRPEDLRDRIPERDPHGAHISSHTRNQRFPRRGRCVLRMGHGLALFGRPGPLQRVPSRPSARRRPRPSTAEPEPWVRGCGTSTRAQHTGRGSGGHRMPRMRKDRHPENGVLTDLSGLDGTACAGCGAGLGLALRSERTDRPAT